MNHIELSVELMSILRALNYSCELKTIEGKSIAMDIAVQGELSVRHKKMIEMLLGGFLSEFYWVNGKHHIYIREECKGLLPDDDRYSCLIYEMNKVSSDEERINSYGKEYFFNLGDRLVTQPPMLSLWKSFLKATLILLNGYEACRNQYHRKMMPKYWKKKET